MEPSSAFGHQGIDLRYYGRQVRKRFWLIIVLVLVSVTLSVLHIAKTRPMYQATTQLLIERDTPNLVPFEDLITTGGAATYYQTQYRILQSRSLARRVIDALDLSSHAEFAPDQRPPNVMQTLANWAGPLLAALIDRVRQLGAPAEAGAPAVVGAAASATSAPDLEADLVRRFLSRLHVESVPNSHLVNLNFVAHDPRLAADVPNTLARLYIDLGLEMRLSTFRSALVWLNERVNDMRQKVETAELALQHYKEKHDFYSLDDRLPGVMQELTALNASLTEAKMERIGIETLYSQIRRASGRLETMEWMPAIVENPLIQSLKSNYVDLQRTFAQLGKKYGVEHPRMIQLRSQMGTTQEKIGTEISKIVQATQTKYEVARAREAALLTRVEKLKREAQALNKKAIRYGVLKREAESTERLFDLLLTRLKETSISTEVKSGNNIRIIDPAELPRLPINVHPVRSLFTAACMGLLVGVGLVVFIGYLDNTLKTPEEAEEFLGLPVVGAVHRFKRRRDSKNGDYIGLVALQYPRSQVVESFKMLRANLLFSYTDLPRKVFLVTSPHPKDGKTTVAANLAVVMEQTERRVLLVETDMRNPTLHKLFRFDNSSDSSSLSEVLLTEKYEDLLTVFDRNLTIVPAGKKPPNPSELLGSKRMQRFIEFAREHYDVVIIDSPPILAVSDPLVLSPLVDSILVVLRAGSTPRDHARRAVAQFVALQAEQPVSDGRAEEHNSSNRGLALVMNFLDVREGGAYGSYHGYYSDEKSKGA